MRKRNGRWLILGLLLAVPLAAQDPVEVDAKHYRVEIDNEHVRVLRITYGPGDKSVLHVHPDAVAVMLTDQHVRFHNPDGTSNDMRARAGDVLWTPGGTHLPENLGTKPMELCRRHGISKHTFYAWKAKYGNLRVCYWELTLSLAAATPIPFVP